jgi:hypothetical protein
MANKHDVIIFSVGLIAGGACAVVIAIKLMVHKIEIGQAAKNNNCTCKKPDYLEVGSTGVVFCNKCFKDKSE